ncbi:MAG: hypothetical protein EP332_14260 [Bacteroidetes bacterium]|nr:MAG: hypothetical protein EP332_14260 [Bacteroidota bacterium]
MNTISNFSTGLFFLSTFLTLAFFYLAAKKVKSLVWISLLLFAIQGIAGFQGFYSDFSQTPPRFAFLIGPSLLLLLLFFAISKFRALSTQLDLGWLILLNAVRIPVELGLHSLYEDGLVPQMMTYAGYNFDVFSGLSAPFIWWLWTKKGMAAKNLILAWNTVCLLLVLTIVTIAVGAAPTAFQAWSFDVPNTGVVVFPVQWLPGLIVPIVLFSHIALFKRLLAKA